ncbi:MAG: PAS domain S-box protein, partial [Rhodanobacter sp.]
MEKNAPGFPRIEDQTILDACPDAIFILGPDGRILNANRAAARCYGYTIEELRQLNAAELAAPELKSVASARFDGMRTEAGKFDSCHQRHDGSLLTVEIHSQPISFHGQQVVFVSVRDMSERKQAQLQLQEKEHFLQRILDTEPGTVYVYDLAEQRNVYINRHWSDAFGYSAEQAVAIGNDLSELFHPDDLPAITDHHQRWRDGKDDETRALEYRLRDVHGDWHWVISRETPFSRNKDGQVVQVLGIANDISVRKHAEVWLGRQKQLLEMIVAGAQLPLILAALVRAIESQSPGMLGSLLLLDDDGLHLRHGAAPSLPAEFIASVDGQMIGPRAGCCGTAIFRHEAVYVKDLRTDPLWDDYRVVAMRLGLVAAWSQPITDGSGHVLGTFAMYYRHPSLPEPTHLRLMETAVHLASIAISRHRKEVALKEKDTRLVKAQKVAHLGFIEWNLKTDAVYCSDEVYSLCGIEREIELVRTDIFEKIVHPGDREMVQHALERAILGIGEYDINHRIVHSDGSAIWVHAQAELIRDPHQDASVLLGTMIDISKRKAAEEALEGMTRLYAALSQCNQAIVRCSNEDELFPQICRGAVEFGGMRMVLIGKVDESRRTVRVASAFGVGASYRDSFGISLVGDSPESRGPAAMAIRDGQPYWCQDFQLDPLTQPWHKEAARLGWNSSATIPLKQRGVAVGVLVVYSERREAFDKPAQDLLIEMAADISFALDRFASEAERKLNA